MDENADTLELKNTLDSLDGSCAYLKKENCIIPKRDEAERFIRDIMTLFFSSLFTGSGEIENTFYSIKKYLYDTLDSQAQIDRFLSRLPLIKKRLLYDVSAIYEGDPAATSAEEIILCYPGFFATAVHRIAHFLYNEGVKYLPRLMSEIAHEKTGIDIHPGADIGERFCIDHGTGVVIGETCVIGDGVKIYQGVTLGAKSFKADDKGVLVKGGKRHPTIGNNCVIYAGATILGGDTVIGDNCVVGGNVWLTHSLPKGSTIYYEEKGGSSKN